MLHWVVLGLKGPYIAWGAVSTPVASLLLLPSLIQGLESEDGLEGQFIILHYKYCAYGEVLQVEFLNTSKVGDEARLKRNKWLGELLFKKPLPW